MYSGPAIRQSPARSLSGPTAGRPLGPRRPRPLVSGDRDAVLVDSLVTKEQSEELTDWLVSAGKNLTQIYITHGHADHFFGLNTVLKRFPDAKPVALAEIVPFAEEQTTLGWMQIWEGIFPGQLLEKPMVPSALKGRAMIVEGFTLQPIKFGRSDVDHSSAVYIPELDALISGNMIYNDIHVWMAQSDHEQRMAWIKTR